MTRATRAHSRVLAGLITACAVGPLLAYPQVNEQSRVMKLTPGNPFLLDFSGSPEGGVSAGSFNNVAFNLNLREPVRKLAVRRGEAAPGVMATNDYADCTQGQESLLEGQIRSLPAGDATFVDYVDVELLPFPQKELKIEANVCYGFRTAHGAWQWRLSRTPMSLDAATNRLRARLWVKQANVDALKLVFDGTMPRHYLRAVTVTTQPPSDRPR